MMRFALAMMAVLGMSSCGMVTAERRPYVDPVTEAAMAPYAVNVVNISVPRTLVVSEADTLYPTADIVWRGELGGDRHAQVGAVIGDAVALGTGDLTRGRPANVDIAVVRFHGLTEKARFFVGGVYSIRFLLTIRDPMTGAVIDGPRLVNADIPYWGRNRAIADTVAGRQERTFIVDGLARIIRDELLIAKR